MEDGREDNALVRGWHAAARMMFSMWLIEDVQHEVGRMQRLSKEEKAVLGFPSVHCVESRQLTSRRNEHLLFDCTDN